MNSQLELALSAQVPAPTLPPAEDPRFRNRLHIQQIIRTAKHWPRRPDPTVVRAKPAGWLLPHLLSIDDGMWGRWDYWARTMLAGRLLDDPIPPIEFTHAGMDGVGNGPARKMIEASLNAIARDDWRGWSHWRYLDYFLDWLLYGFGQLRKLPAEPEPGAFSRLYQVFCLEAVLAWPHDYLGDLMAENRHGRHQGFYPTPHDVCEMMVKMQMGDEDLRGKSVCDPAVGTGRMLLHASNHSMRLYGTDINATCVKACTVNLWLYAPWGARPLAFLDR
jgi:hypothetical protein